MKTGLCSLGIKGEADCPENLTICCFFCSKKDTCEKKCPISDIDPEGKCDDLQEKSEIQNLNEICPTVVKDLEDLMITAKDLDEKKKKLTDQLKDVMEKYSITKWSTEKIDITYVKSSKRRTIDSKKLKADHPDIAEAYTKESDVAASVRVKVK